MLATVEKWHSLRFLTLTLKATGQSLADQFDRLNAAFTKLRRDEVWTDNVKQAIAVPEVTVGRENQWHLHLHILCSGDFIPQPQLKKAWHESTGDSYIVHVEAVHNKANAAKYVAGYIAGGNEVARWSPDRIREFSDAVHGKRMLRTYGKCKLESGDDDNEPDVIGPSTHLCSVLNLLRAEKSGCDQIRHAVDILARLGFAHSVALDRDPADKTLPPPTAREITFATRICHRIEEQYPTIPDEATCEQTRRRAFEEPEPQPAAEYTQRAQDWLINIHREWMN